MDDELDTMVFKYILGAKPDMIDQLEPKFDNVDIDSNIDQEQFEATYNEYLEQLSNKVIESQEEI